MDLISSDTCATPLVDLAFRKPARSSSVSPWSRYPDPERDARGANNAVLHDDLAFHTQLERNPWWLVDLDDECVVHEVQIVNRRQFPERFVRFQISSSLDGIAWTRRFVKTDDAPVSSDAGAPWLHRFPVPFSARYVMISLMGEGMLHLRRVHVFGRIPPMSSPRPKHRSITIADHTRAPSPAGGDVRVALVGNCQASALAQLFRRSRQLHVTTVADVNDHGTNAYEEALFKIYNKIEVDFVLSPPIYDQASDLYSPNLKKLYGDHFLSYTNIYFTGLHPDIIYVGHFGQRLQSPMGDYHSKIVLASYLQGLSAEACGAMFNPATYENFGFFRAYTDSFAELIQRDESNAIAFSHILQQMTVSTQTMLTTNHPSARTLFELGRCIAQRLGVDPSDFVLEMFNSPLNEDCFWPVYPDIREHHNLQWATPMLFFPRLRSGGRPMSLAAFIAGSYAAYDGADPGALRASDAAQHVLSLPF